MSVLIDFGAIKAGGGVQLSLNFLDQLLRHPQLPEQFYVLAPESSEISKKLEQQRQFTTFHLPRSYTKRIFFEMFTLPRIIRDCGISIVFTFFGPGLPHSSKVKSIVSVAYPIICYPESPYWLRVPWKHKLKKKALNLARIMRLKNATLIIAETDVMKSRLMRTLGLCDDKFIVVPPSPSEYLQRTDAQNDPQRCNVLLLSGTDPHKNLDRLYAIANIFRSRGIVDIRFIVSVRFDAYLWTLRHIGGVSVIDDNLLESYFTFLGPVPPEQISQAYQQSDFLMSLSDLESFSNNYMEAWKAGVPLIVSDRDFAHHICGDSAIYVDPHDAAQVADTIIAAAGNAELKARLVSNGRERLAALPTQEERFATIIKLLLKDQT